MTRRGAISRADLLRIASSGHDRPEVVLRAGRLCGYDFDRDSIQAPPREPMSDEETREQKPQTSTVFSATTTLVETPFFLASAYSTGAERRAPETTEFSQPYRGWQNAPPPPKWLPLASRSEVETTLRTLLAPPRNTRQVDAKRTVDRLSRAEPLLRLPQREKRAWPGHLVVVLDRSTHLVPYWGDQGLVLAYLKALLPHAIIDVITFDDRSRAFMRRGDPFGSIREVVNLAPDLLVLGDLGSASGNEAIEQVWLKLARGFGRDRARVLSPFPEEGTSRRLRDVWRIADWVRRRRMPYSPEHLAEELLCLVSPAIRIEPNLLRQVRVRALSEAGPEIEALAWNHPAMEVQFEEAGALMPETAKGLRRRFAGLDRDKRREAIYAMREWRGDLHPAIWAEEVLELDPDSRALLPAGDEEDARKFFADTLQRSSKDPESAALLRWADRMGNRASRLVKNPDARALIWRAKKDDPTFAALDPGTVPEPDSPLGQVAVWMNGGKLDLTHAAATDGSLLGMVSSDDGLIRLDTVPHSSFRDQPANGAPAPEMIALPTGTFLMGSPDGEEGRYDDEGPQHEVEITEPFALAKYPVTLAEYDAFCEATGREKPDDRGWGRGRRPVINVSWEDAQAYCDWLSEQTGEAYRLPSEAEWEYACRAGTTTRYWWGDDWSSERANGEGTLGKTTEVGRYDPNPWGLYDTHGTVWEWCEDRWQADYKQPRTQQVFTASGGTLRVFRGGSWDLTARGCRSAYRDRDAPDVRSNYIGFRPARDQATGAQAGSGGAAGAFDPARGAVSGANGQRPGRGDSPPPQGGGQTEPSARDPVRRRVLPGGSAAIPLSDLPPAPFVIRTDRAELVIQRITRSDLGGWASGMGRDRFGLWADFTLDDIRQRLRYCPPGQFTMGSPESEAGRHDDEGPQTDITLEQGFWLFDTPVTQELYEAVTGKKNPSHFASPTRPVEQVSWSEAHDFIARINQRFEQDDGDGLQFRLPSEAEWEYACRAGTTEATWAGPMEILGVNNAPILDDIAWYGGNSGKDFELDDGYDSSDWKEKRHDHSKAGSMPVKMKRANPWGLHDMLGNVWEWCEDAWQNSHEGVALDGAPRPVSEQDGVTNRVIRGGSWYDTAGYCRSAFRDWNAPVNRGSSIGFRPARGQVTGAQASSGGAAGAFGPTGAR